LKTHSLTIDKAENVAAELKELLEKSENIHSAGIFLDLNATPDLHRNILAM
jgi:hypothetical protein